MNTGDVLWTSTVRVNPSLPALITPLLGWFSGHHSFLNLVEQLSVTLWSFSANMIPRGTKSSVKCSLVPSLYSCAAWGRGYGTTVPWVSFHRDGSLRQDNVDGETIRPVQVVYPCSLKTTTIYCVRSLAVHLSLYKVTIYLRNQSTSILLRVVWLSVSVFKKKTTSQHCGTVCLRLDALPLSHYAFPIRDKRITGSHIAILKYTGKPNAA